MAYSEYRALTPIDNIENDNEYLNALDWALQNESIRNIALTGPYGSGKSSIIESFLSQDKKKKSGGFCRKKPIRKTSLKVSMATFQEAHSPGANEHGDKIDVNADEVEKGILKQLFYKVKPERIPQSRYRKLHGVRCVKAFMHILLGLSLAYLFMCIFVPTARDWLVNSVSTFLQQFSVSSEIASWVCLAAIALLISSVASYLYRTVISKFRVKEVTLPTATTIENGKEDSDSVFNRNLDEIMYFFESTDYRTVFFEDLDRLDDRKVFVHLRELNNLLNNDDSIKGKPIVFVYAVKDDIFSKEDRTKFFDFIIPVIPVINSTNSGEILLQRLQEAKNNGIEHNITQSFVLDISPFISDMRMLQNTYNEFVLYKKTLQTSQELNLSDEQMFAIIVFKNLYPSDFADIQDEKGILKKAFTDKQSYISAKKDELQQEIDGYATAIEKAKYDVLVSVRELKYAMFCTITDGGLLNEFTAGALGNKPIAATTILDDDFDLSQLLQQNYRCVNYTDRNNRNLRKDYNKETVKGYVERWEHLRKVKEIGLQKMQESIQSQKNQQHALIGMSLKTLIGHYSTDEVFSPEVRDNRLLVFLLRRGYIDEKYANYINYFKGMSITKDDMNFILSVKNHEPLEFDYALSKTAMVIQRLQAYEFENKAIYNFDLLEQLLTENAESDKLDFLISQLADEDAASWRFIDEFIDRTKHPDAFVRMLIGKWAGIWVYISGSETLTYERKLHYLRLIVDNTDDTSVKTLNVQDCLKRFLEKHSDILRELSACKSIDRVNAIIDCLDICFAQLFIDGVNETVLEHVFSGKRYQLNDEMLQNALLFKNPELLSLFQTQPYSVIKQLSYAPVTEYISENLQEYVESVMLGHENLADNVEDIIALSGRLKENEELCRRLVVKESFHISDIEEFLGDQLADAKDGILPLWDALLYHNKVDADWDNVVRYWQKYELSEALCSYIVSHIDQLVETDASVVDDALIKQLIRADIEPRVQRRLIPVLRLQEFDLSVTELPEITLQIMVECNYFSFTAVRLKALYAVHPHIAVAYILRNQDAFVEVLDEVSMVDTMLEELLISTELSVANKRTVFARFATEYMTEGIAMKMNELGVPITARAFDAAWNIVDATSKEILLYKNLELLQDDGFVRCFTDLGEKYSGFLDRTCRHDVSISNTKANKQLAERLKEVGYITSYSEYTETSLGTIHQSEPRTSSIKCRVKQVK